MNREEIQEKIYRINCLTEETDSIYHQAAVQFGLSDSSLLIFYMLYTNKGQCRLSDLYMVSGTSKQTVNSAIRKMEKEGMVYLEMYDGKSKMVYLTEKGKSYAEKTAGKLYEAECETFREWTQEEIDQYLQLTERYNRTLRKQILQLVGNCETSSQS